MEKEQYAYLAGAIDCDGSLECQREIQKNGKTPRYSIRLSFTMATDQPIETIANWLGLKYKTYPSVDERRSPRRRLHIPKGIAVQLIEKCLPYLILKKRQAEILIEIEKIRASLTPGRNHYGHNNIQPMPPEWEQRVEPLYREFRSLKCNKRPGGKGRSK